MVVGEGIYIYRFIPACAGNRNRGQAIGQTPTVHPRVCGEQHSRLIPGYSSSGSSPRVRGTAATNGTKPSNRWFIPACAGNSGSFCPGWHGHSVHPRVCGEQLHCLRDKTASDGSSPRVRGTDTMAIRYLSYWRFIPACAGNSSVARFTAPDNAVHPRVCGEQVQLRAAQPAPYGSSPRVRGKVRHCVCANARRRFIPACAGNRSNASIITSPIPVHPRVCGEQIVIVVPGGNSDGSSPRVRGTVPETVYKRSRLRFIPACAGNRQRDLRRRSPPPVHPRVCGEQRRPHNKRTGRDGSSPRVRGTGQGALSGEDRVRFIPACAGNRACTSVLRRPEAVHPRVCGEQFSAGLQTHVCVGSSPRVRGTDRGEPHEIPSTRFIPACAGNSHW